MKSSVRFDWVSGAEGLAQKIPRARLHPIVTAWAQNRPAGERWAVAFSGGADSLALLLLMWAHWPRRRARLLALHFNHRLRGAAAGQDQRFCARVCAALGVEFAAGRWAGTRRDASEAEARAARFEFFGRELRRRRARVLWFGHQQDDIAESMLMRLARGSGAAGLAAPRPCHTVGDGRTHVRPLLTLKKSDIVAALAGLGAHWREDATNAGPEYFRNRVRGTVVPAWIKAAGRDALAGAALTRDLLDEDNSALEEWLDGLRVLEDDGALDLMKLKNLPLALSRRALHRWLLAQTGAGELSRQGFECLLAASRAATNTRHSLGVGAFAVIKRGRLRLERGAKKEFENVPGFPLRPN